MISVYILPYLLVLIDLSIALKLKSHYDNFSISETTKNNWDLEITKSIKDNIFHCKARKVSLKNIYHITDYMSKSKERNITVNTTDTFGSDQFYYAILYNYKNRYFINEVKQFQSLPSTILKSHHNFYKEGSRRSYNLSHWGASTEARWEVPLEHPGQNRSNCIKQTMLLSSGEKEVFYDDYKSIHRMSYILSATNAFIHPTGFVGLSCGYYKGHEGCETRWEHGVNWYQRCSKYLQTNNLAWNTLWSTSTNKNYSSEKLKIFEACKDMMYEAIKTNQSIIPRYYNRVMVISALWDWNFHHFMADSLARMIKYIHFLRRNPDIYIHIRSHEEYELFPEIRNKSQKYATRVMRNRMFNLLQINPKRLIYGPVLARIVYIPRALHCSYALSNPLEIRSMARELIDSAWIRFQKMSNIKQSYPPYYSKNNKESLKNTNKTWNIILQQRYSTEGYKDYPYRDWNNETYNRVVSVFSNIFHNHRVIKMQSFLEKKESYCTVCAIMDYQHANVLVGMHGAGLTNMIFMPRGSVIVEIVGLFTDVHMPVCGYSGALAATMGHHLYYYAIPWRNISEPGKNWDDFDPMIPAKEAYDFYKKIIKS